jgi:hypothetical protein
MEFAAMLTTPKYGQTVFYWSGSGASAVLRQETISKLYDNGSGLTVELYPSYSVKRVAEIVDNKREALQTQALKLRDEAKATIDLATQIWGEAAELPSIPALEAA